MQKADELNFNSRISKILASENFRKDCVTIYRNNPYFKYLDLIKQLAFINIKDIPINGKLFDASVINNDVLEEVRLCYADIDAIYPQMPLLPTTIKNMQFVTNTPNPERLSSGEEPRSSCAYTWKKAPNGTDVLEREIFINLEQSIKTKFVGAHEFAHSLSPSFAEGKRHVDPAMQEFCPVIMDMLSLELYGKRNPNQAHVVNELKREHLVINVVKARYALMDACVIQIMTGELTYDEAVKQYGSIISPRMIDDCLKRIEQNRFNPMYEARYVLSQVMATALQTKLKTNPEEVVKNFKEVLSVDNKIYFDQAIEMLNLPSKEVLLENYKANFNDLTKQK